MHWIIRLLPGRQMASRVSTIVQRGRQVIVVVDVARSAGNGGMAIGEGESCYAVVECRPRPTHRRCMAC